MSTDVGRAGAACVPPIALESDATDQHAIGVLRDLSLDWVRDHQLPDGTTQNVDGDRRTRDNTLAVIALAEAGELGDAADLLQLVLPSQQLDPSQPFYGYFPDMLGEAPTDDDETMNFYVATFLAVLLERHAADFDAALVDDLEQALAGTAAIAALPPPHVNNTGQVLLQAFGALRGGELLGDAGLVAAGLEHWNAFVERTYGSGLAEANSPNYTKIQLYVLGLMAEEADDACVRAEAAAIRRLVWWEITKHYHVATRQIAGPFVRTHIDRMAYELTGIHFSLFRESGERIALPPTSTEGEFATGNLEQPLHAVLATLFAPSWPQAWADWALASHEDDEFRERLINWTNFGRPNTGFIQLTSFSAPTATLGSRNRDPFGLNTETRDLVGYAADGGDVGVFRMRIGPLPQYLTRHVSVQNDRSVATALIADRFRPATVSSMDFTLEWRGTPGHAPAISDETPALGDSALVDWMGTKMRIRILDFTAAGVASPTLEVSHPDAETLRLIWHIPLPTAALGNGLNAAPVVVGGFALHLEDRADHFADTATPLAAPTLVPEASPFWRLSWASPDGLLEARFDNADARSAGVEQWIDAVAIPEAPLQSSLAAEAEVPGVASSVEDGDLSVSGIGASTIDVKCVSGLVKVNGKNPDLGTSTCNAVDTITVDGGRGAEKIDLSTLGPSQFGSLTSVHVDGGGGNDVLVGSNLADTIDGGAGNDSVQGRIGNDTLRGNVGVDNLVGATGDDTLVGGDGNDTLRADAGADNLDGGLGADKLYGGPDADDLDGGDGSDTLDGGTGGDRIDGGAGIDALTYASRTADVDVTIGDGTANDGEAGEGDEVVSGTENVTGGKGNDTLVGDGVRNTLTGGQGTNTLTGNGGPDILKNGPGAESFSGGDGNDQITSKDSVSDSVSCGADKDTVTADGADVIAGDCETIKP